MLKNMSAREKVIQLLDQWEKSDIYADLLLDQFFRTGKFQQADKGLIQEIFFGVIRWRKKLDWIIESFFQGKISKAPRFVRYILQTGIYQILFLQRVPNYAIVNEAARLARKRGGGYWAGKINGVLRNFIRNKDKLAYPDPRKNPVENISVVHSHPDWLVKKWLQRWGREETIRLCEANNRRPDISLRINRLKITAEEFSDYLTENGAEFERLDDESDFFIVQNFADFAGSDYFRQGYFSVQDASAGLAGALVDPRPGEKILDLCAAPGGKSGHLLELSSGKAAIFSADVSFQRLRLVKQNLSRLKFPTNRLIQADATNFSSQSMDKILIDAPCSGLGVLSKRADLRWKRTPEEMRELPNLQFSILENAATLVKPGGIIVYATCTIESEENEQIVRQFLATHPEFQIESAAEFVPDRFVSADGWVQTFPHVHGMDGSFGARLKKISEN